MMKESIRRALADVLEGLGMYEEDYVLELERPRLREALFAPHPI